MKGKILLFGIVLLLLASFVSAELPTDFYRYWSMNGVEDYTGTDNLTIDGATLGSDSCIDDKCYYFDGTNDYAYTTKTYTLEPTDFTFCWWLNVTEAVSGQGGIVGMGEWTTDDFITLFFDSGSRAYNRVDTVYSQISDAATGYIQNELKHYCYVSTSTTNQDMYVDGTKDTGWTGETIIATGEETYTNFYLGKNGHAGGGYWLQGYIDEVVIFNRSLSSSEILSLYNNDGIPVASNINVSFNTPVYEGTEETISLLFEDLNLTENTTATLTYDDTEYAGVIDFSNESYVQFDYNVTTSNIYQNNTAINLLWNYTLDYANGTQENGSTSEEDQYLLWNLTAYPRVTITAFDIINSILVVGFDANDSVGTQTTTTDELYFRYNQTDESWPVTLQAPNLAWDTQNLNFTSGYLNAYQFDLYTTNSVNFTFLDEITHDPITENVSVEFISTLFSYNYTAENGTLYVELLSPESYVVRYEADSYGRIRSYLFNLTNNTHNDFTLYLLDDSNSTETTVTVYDQLTLATIEDAVVIVQRYYQPDNVYNTVAMYETDVAGISYFDLEHDNELYKFLVEYPFGTREYTSDEFYVSEAAYNVYITLTEDIANNFFSEQDVGVTITYDNVTEEFTASYTDTGSGATEYCLYIKKYGQYSLETLNSSCLTATSGSIILGGVEDDAVNYALFTAQIDGDQEVIGSVWEELVSDELGAGNFGVFMTAVFVTVFVFLVSLHWMALLLGTSSLIFTKLIGIFTIDWPYIFGIVFASIVLALIINVWKK